MRTTFLSILAASCISIAGCTTNPSTGKNQFLLYSPEQVAQISEHAKPELTKQYGGQVQSAELRKYVTGVGKRLARNVESEYKDLDWEFTTLNSDVINAFALPGGKVFITRGLLEKLSNEAEVAAVLGHEIGHVTARHIDERMTQQAAIETGVQVGGGLTKSDIASAALGLVGQGYMLKFSRDQESEADMQGLKYMTKAGYNPQGMEGVLHVLIDASKGGSQPEILSTHPNPERRLQDVEARIKKDYSQEVRDPKYKLFEDRFETGAAPYLRSNAARSGSSRDTTPLRQRLR
jgi:predicted Zn-dependent protease